MIDFGNSFTDRFPRKLCVIKCDRDYRLVQIIPVIFLTYSKYVTNFMQTGYFFWYVSSSFEVNYRPRSSGDNTFGSVRVCVRPFVCGRSSV